MGKDGKRVTERILNLTLEIIYLLTGEDYTVVKKSTDHVTSSNSSHLSDDTSPMPTVHSPLGRANHDRKILELTEKIMDPLTGEVPIRCEDVAVYLSLEEWEYLEGHKDLYKDVTMENNQPLISLSKRRGVRVQKFISGISLEPPFPES
ncbi:gastrula zinc finger protein XlCGF66.1-like [Pelodytes ibericus]